MVCPAVLASLLFVSGVASDVGYSNGNLAVKIYLLKMC